jgi:hypothetical protein
VTVRLARADTGAALGSAVTADAVAADPVVHLPLESNATDISPQNLGTFDNVGGVTFDGTRATFNGSNYLQKTGLSGLPVIGTGDFTLDATCMIPVGEEASWGTVITLLPVSGGAANFSLLFPSLSYATEYGGPLIYLGSSSHAFSPKATIPYGTEFFVRIKRQSGQVSLHMNGVQHPQVVNMSGASYSVQAFSAVEIGNISPLWRIWPNGGTLRHVRLVIGEALPGGGQMAPLPTWTPTDPVPGVFEIVTAHTGECHRVIQSPYGDRNHLVAKVTPGGA